MAAAPRTCLACTVPVQGLCAARLGRAAPVLSSSHRPWTLGPSRLEQNSGPTRSAQIRHTRLHVLVKAQLKAGRTRNRPQAASAPRTPPCSEAHGRHPDRDLHGRARRSRRRCSSDKAEGTFVAPSRSKIHRIEDNSKSGCTPGSEGANGLTNSSAHPAQDESASQDARVPADEGGRIPTAVEELVAPLPCDHASSLDLPMLQSADVAHQLHPQAAPPAGKEGGGLELTAETAAVATVYFVQGILGLSRLAVTFFLKDDFHLDPAEVAILTGAAAFPWLIKPLYGFISDGIPLFGYRRRSYLIGSGLLGALAWLLMATVVDNKYAAVAMIIMSSLGAAVSDVVVDSMVVARARGESQSLSGSLQSLCWGSSAAGSLLSAYFSGSLVEHWGPRAVFGITALLPLITTGVGFFVPEERVHISNKPSYPPSASASAPSQAELSPDPRPNSPRVSVEGSRNVSLMESLKTQLVQLRDTFGIRDILFPTLFIFFWQATPHSETAMFFYTTNVLGLGPEFLGRVRLVTAFASLAGVGLFNFCLRSIPLRRIFLWSSIAGAILGASPLILVSGLNREWGISDQFFLLGDSLVLAVLGQISFMPVLVLAARVCPPGIEATLFASLMSISNGAGVVGGLLGAGVTQWLNVTSTDFQNLGLLLVICNFSSLLALPLLRLLPEDGDDQTRKANAQK